jgi:chromate transporter
MQRQVVDVHQWMSTQEFSALFALAQAAPGPNLMIVPLIGWRVAGWSGVLVSSLAKFGPSSIVTILVLRVWKRFQHKQWRIIVQAGLVPMTVGLVAASAALIVEASVQTWSLGAIMAICAFLSYRTRLHPLWVLGIGALAGLSGVVQF